MIRICSLAAIPVATIIAVGVASPKAHGQEITKTEIAISKEKLNVFPSNNQIIKESKEIPMTMGTKIPLILSANREIGALLLLASSTNLIILS